ncbi:hypothetical protein CEK26_001750 [Fusarium fujikuroi]|uniref:Uncharacterized protein n=1 Tax=Fusarium fujikuroi TaxID=5127 RepID=A0A2H3RJW0_FUSFU|nr:uncharacterized protein Y057_3133 [Fusarium fujikuroi]QGI90535.1 hypothetical protein CEK26_001750 [Fusarium fujikuroi]SCN66101.1 uncharacterized protein FFE2_00262 [Fusarium fujikuroi]SCN69028.1 uncharacterized protein FFC1_00257 [Fusarium fujikuroi]SCO28313.1 uncharacterized protein FFNC_00260 [Fusarium fujikuroi]
MQPADLNGPSPNQPPPNPPGAFRRIPLPPLGTKYAHLPVHFTGINLSTRVDHMGWRCHDVSCLAINSMPYPRCRQCHLQREAGAHALGPQYEFIGILVDVDGRTNEHWYYPNTLAIREMYRGSAPRDLLKAGSPPVSWRPGGIDGIDGIDPNNNPRAAERSGNPGVGAQNNTSAPLRAVDAVGTSGEGRAARTGEVIEVSHMGGGVENGRNGEVDDEDLEEPEEQEEEAQSKSQGKQPARQAQLKKRKKQPENGGEAQGGATGSGSGKRKKRA